MSQGLCPSCGAAVKMAAGKTEAKCKYCGSIVVSRQAEEQFAQTSEFKKNEFNGTLLLAEMAREEGDYKEAIDQYNRFIEQQNFFKKNYTASEVAKLIVSGKIEISEASTVTLNEAQQISFSEIWLSRGICLVHENIRSSSLSISFKDAINSWKTAVKYAKNSEAFRKRVALEIYNVLRDIYSDLQDEDGSPYWDVRTVDDKESLTGLSKLFLLLESAVGLSLDLYPTNLAIMKDGILLCEIFLQRLERSLNRYVRDNPEYNYLASQAGKSDGRDLIAVFLKVKDKYEKAFEKANPKSAKQYRETKAKEQADKAQAEIDAVKAKSDAEAAARAEVWKKAFCFVATACYGNYDHPIVLELRLFRDNYLETLSAGRAFVRWYYKWSPPFAAIVAKSEILKAVVRGLIVIPSVRIARLIKKKQNPNGSSDV